MNEPLISVIIPIYNNVKYVGECLDSILRQTYSNTEIIVVNDGSTDQTLQIIERYANSDSRIRIVNKENEGQAIARNIALDISRGDYITMVDSDDTLHPDFLKVMLQSIQTYDADVVCCGITQDAAKLSVTHAKISLTNNVAYLKKGLKADDFTVSSWGKLYKACIWKNLRFEPQYYEDLEIFPRVILRAPKVLTVESRLYYYRNNPDSFINTFSPKRLDALKAVDKIVETVKGSHDYQLITLAYSRKLRALFNIYYLTAGQPEYAAINRQCLQEIKKLRGRFLFSRVSSMKLRCGIVVSYMGIGFMNVINNMFHISK